MKYYIIAFIVLAAVWILFRSLRQKDPAIYYTAAMHGNYNARTIPPIGIFIDERERGNELLLYHELVHWSQYQEMGLLPYYLQYMANNIRYGYDANPMELEARYQETEEVRNNYTAAVRSGQARTVYNRNFRT